MSPGVGEAPGSSTWMQRPPTLTPRHFRWNAARTDQVLAYWVNLDGADWKAPERRIDLEVLDTKSDPNTIKIEAVGTRSMSFFLNDEIVDLERPVRVVINGHLEHEGVIPVEDANMAKVGRDFDFLFNREPLRIRDSMYFGWLTPARLVELKVRARDP